MPQFPPQVGHIVKAAITIQLRNNAHITVLSSASHATLAKGAEAEITAVQPMHIELNCKDGSPAMGIAAWGLKIRVARAVWGTYFD